MRGLAALWVLLFHLYGVWVRGLPGGRDAHPTPFWLNWINYGHFAVTIFIVLSGFCLMLPVVNDREGQLRGGFKGFMQRRALRIIPPYYAAIALVLITTYASHLTKAKMDISDSSDIWKLNFEPGAILSHILLVQAWFEQYCYRYAGLWSVGVEWNIYLFFALLFLPLWRRLGGVKGGLWSLFVILLIATILGYGAPFALPEHHNLSWCYPWYLTMFILGMCAAVVVSSKEPLFATMRARVPWEAISVFGLILIFGIALPSGVEIVQMLEDAAIGLVCVTTIIACACSAMRKHNGDFRTVNQGPLTPVITGIRRAFESKPAIGLGLFSYSLYLIHGLIITRLAAFALTHLHNRIAYALFIWVGGLAACFLAATILYLLLEKPFLSLRSRSGSTTATHQPNIAPGAPRPASVEIGKA